MAAFIQVEDQQVKRGIFSFVFEATGDEELFESFFEMEKKYHTDRIRFSDSMRHALERFVYSEFSRVYGIPYDSNCSIKEADSIFKESILEKAQGNLLLSGITSPIKIFLCLRCCNQEHLPLYENALQRWRMMRSYSVVDLKKAIFKCYEFACSEHHEDLPGIESYDPNEANEENCRRWLYFLYHLLQAYFKAYVPGFLGNNILDENYIPLEDYVRVPKSVSKNLGVPQIARKSLYISESNGIVKYYWICDADQDQTENREIDALQKIWADDNDFDPRNVIRLKERLPINEKLSKLVFSLPSKPQRLTWTILENMTIQEREKVFVDACRSISSLHDNLPPLYHRDITPDAFILCKSKNGYKLFLNAFDCVKDTDENAQYTVGAKVAGNMEKDKKRPYIAPEIIDLKDTDSAWKDVDWKAADIYALGMMGVFIFTGDTDISMLHQVEGLSDRTINKIVQMCKPIDSRSNFI